MSNLHPHMPMRAHAYKNHNELEENIPYKSVQREPTKAQPDTIAFTLVFPRCMWAFGSRAKLMLIALTTQGQPELGLWGVAFAQLAVGRKCGLGLAGKACGPW